MCRGMGIDVAVTGIRRPLRSVSVSALAAAVVMALAICSSVGSGVRLLAGTLVYIGGNDNPHSLGIDQILGGNPLHPQTSSDPLLPVGVYGKGYVDPNNPASPYFGYAQQRVEWPAQFPGATDWDGVTTFDASQRQGVANLHAAIVATLELNPDDPVTVVGYSSSANVVVRELRALQAAGAPWSDKLSFVVIAGMNRPSGGLAQLLSGITVPWFDVPLDGYTPLDTPYKVLDVSWRHETISSFPNNPLNLLAVVNALMGFMLHIDYYAADMNGPRATPDTTNGNITYVTLRPKRLPLLMPLQVLGVPDALLDLVEPTLTELIDLAYDDVGAGVPTGFRLWPSLPKLIAFPFRLISAVIRGIQDALTPDPPAVVEPAVEPALAAPASEEPARFAARSGPAVVEVEESDVVDAADGSDAEPQPTVTPEPLSIVPDPETTSEVEETAEVPAAEVDAAEVDEQDLKDDVASEQSSVEDAAQAGKPEDLKPEANDPGAGPERETTDEKPADNSDRQAAA